MITKMYLLVSLVNWERHHQPLAKLPAYMIKVNYYSLRQYCFQLIFENEKEDMSLRQIRMIGATNLYPDTSKSTLAR